MNCLCNRCRQRRSKARPLFFPLSCFPSLVYLRAYNSSLMVCGRSNGPYHELMTVAVRKARPGGVDCTSVSNVGHSCRWYPPPRQQSPPMQPANVFSGGRAHFYGLSSACLALLYSKGGFRILEGTAPPHHHTSTCLSILRRLAASCMSSGYYTTKGSLLNGDHSL